MKKSKPVGNPFSDEQYLDFESNSGTPFTPLISDNITSDSETETENAVAHLPQNNYALTTFLLLNTMIGSGILNQPYVFENSGVLGGVFGFLLASVLTWYGLNLLTEAGVSSNIYEYSGLAKHAFGEIGEVIIDVSIIIVTFGAQLGYILVVGDTMTNLFQSWGCASNICNLNVVTGLAVVFLISPFCLYRHFGHLAWLSIFSIVTIVSVLLLVTIGGPLTQNHGSITLINISGMLRSTGSIVFSLNCSSANFQVCYRYKIYLID